MHKLYKREKEIKTRLVSLMGLFLYLCITAVYADTATSSGSSIAVTTAGDMLTRVTDQFPNLMRLVTAFAYVAGFYFVIAGIMKLKHMGEARTQMSHEHSMKGPLLYLFVGTALIYLPSTVNVGMASFWNAPNPYGYVEASSQWSGIITACFTAVQLFGTIAFIRGLFMLSHLSGQGGGQHGTLSKAMSHIIGGIFCINIYEFVKVILATIGVTISGFNG